MLEVQKREEIKLEKSLEKSASKGSSDSIYGFVDKDLEPTYKE